MRRAGMKGAVPTAEMPKKKRDTFMVEGVGSVCAFVVVGSQARADVSLRRKKAFDRN